MTVALTYSKTIAGAALSDSLAGGGTGLDFGQIVTGRYCPIIDQAANTGWATVYVRHNAIVDPIADCGLFIQPFSQSYGGAGANALADFNVLKAKGAASSLAAANDGNGGGLRVEMDADLGGVLALTAFAGTRPQVRIFGRASLGIDVTSAFVIHEDAMVLNSGGSPVDATTPIAGQIGKSGDAVLGDRALLKLRYYLESNATTSGVIMGDLEQCFSYTS